MIRIIVLLYILLSISLHSLPAQTLQDSLVLYYNFNGNFEDSTVNSFDANPAGALLVADKFGEINSAVHFSGGNQSIEVPDIPPLNYDSPKTFSVWVKIDSFPLRGRAIFCSDYHEVGYHGYFLMMGYGASIAIGNDTNFSIDGRKTCKSIRELFPNIWYHLVFVYHSIGDAEIYMFGQPMVVEYEGTATTIAFSNNEGKLGQVDNNYDINPSFASFYGTMDDFMVWDRALNPQEIMQLYNVQK